MQFLKSSARLALISCALWSTRLGHEGISIDDPLWESLWLWALRPIALAILGVWFVFEHLKAHMNFTRRQFFLYSYSGAAVFCIPYIPDMYASFMKAGEAQSVGLSVAFYALGIITYGTIRGGGVNLWVRWTRSIAASPIARAAAFYPLLLITEFFFFHTWHPITYFPALPLPLPAARFEHTNSQSDVKYLLIESYMDGKSRSEIEKGGQLSLGILGERIAEEVEKQARNTQFSSQIHIIFPETFVSVETAEDIHALTGPVTRVLFRNTNLQKIVWIQGAFLANTNVILGTEIERGDLAQTALDTAAPKVTLLRKKSDHMPMFEAASKGISYSPREQQAGLTEEPVPVEQETLAEFARTHQMMICYESLFPSRWIRNKSTLVLTNHHLFTEFKLMNWVYFGYLRTLAFLLSAETKVVSNYNPSGLLLKPGLFEQPAPEPWAVVRVMFDEH